MILDPKSYDFFISYAQPDIAYAETLSATLQTVGRVFFAPKEMILGEDWPTRLMGVIKDAWVTLVIVSHNTLAAHFQKEEILLALKESHNGSHLVIPIRLVVNSTDPPIPFGLNSNNCFDLHTGLQDEIDSATTRLLIARDYIRSRAGLEWLTGRAKTRSPELPTISSDPLREALERVRDYDQSGLLQPSAVTKIQIILMKYHLIGNEIGDAPGTETEL